MKYPYIIAEIGSNWRSLEIAKKQIEAAKECGADAAKFQMFTNKELYGYDDGSKCWGLPRDLVDPLALHCQSVGIDFMCTAFSIDGYKFVDPYVKTHKIASCEADWPELVQAVADLGKPFLRSYGLIERDCFEFNNEIAMLCCAKYPALPEDYSFDQELCEKVILWGLSDHTLGNELAVIASSIGKGRGVFASGVGLGCGIFEKHFDYYITYDRAPLVAVKTPDTVVSVGALAFEEYVDQIKRTSRVLNNKKVEIDPDIDTYAKRRFVPEYNGWYRTKKK